MASLLFTEMRTARIVLVNEPMVEIYKRDMVYKPHTRRYRRHIFHKLRYPSHFEIFARDRSYLDQPAPAGGMSQRRLECMPRGCLLRRLPAAHHNGSSVYECDQHQRTVLEELERKSGCCSQWRTCWFDHP